MFEDQYKFFKSFNSPNLFIAFAEFMFEDVEPANLSEQEQVIFDSLRIRMENLKKKSLAWSKSHWWWRPQKKTVENNNINEEVKTKKQQKNNKKTTQKQEEQDKEQEDITSSFIKEDMCNKLHVDVSFDKFWNLYPNKKDKKKAKQKFDRLSLLKKQLAIDWILKLKKSDTRQKWFIPLPTTYLNWERREDEIENKNSRINEKQEFQRKARLEEAKKILSNNEDNHEANWNQTNQRKSEISCS